MLKLMNISKSFQDKIIFENFSLEIKENEKLIIRGRSGIGKTTLFRIISGLIKVDSGEVYNDFSTNIMFQEDRLIDEISVLGNLKLFSEKSDEEIKNELAMVGLENELNSKIKSLSGGMKRRVSLVRTLIDSFELVLLDEPFKGLDEETKKLVLDYILLRTKNKSLIIVLHEASEVLMLNYPVVTLEEK